MESGKEEALGVKYKFLQKKLNSLYSEIKSIKDIARNVEENTQCFPEFRGRYKELDKLHSEFIKIWDELLILCLSEDKKFPLDDKILNGARSMVYECNTVYENFMNPVTPSGPQSKEFPYHDKSGQLDCSTATVVRARLPKINIPTYSGGLLDWPQWRDLFTALVHSETSLTSIERFQYLIGTLTGEPLRVVSGYTVSEDNYQHAWKALNDRYNNKRLLATAYLNRIRQFKISPSSSSNSQSLRNFLQVVAKSFTEWENLKIPDEADYLKLQLALECLDSDTRRLFEEKEQGTDFPKYQSLIDFIQNRCKIIEVSETQATHRITGSVKPSTSLSRSRPSKGISALTQGNPSNDSPQSLSYPRTSPGTNCPHCSGSHLLFKCYSYKSLPLSERLSLVKSHHLCSNCLRKGHFAAKCSSKSSCFHCKKKHHSLLHDFSLTSTDRQSPLPATSDRPSDTATGQVLGSASVGGIALLGTAMVDIQDSQGRWQSARAVIDSGSQFSLMTLDCAHRLGLHWSPSKHAVSGVGQTKLPQAKGAITCTIQSRINRATIITCKALVMSNLTTDLPTALIPPSIKTLFKSVTLADKTFWESRPVDLLLGADIFCQILSPEPRVIISEQFGTLPTVFGHVILGIPPHCSTSTAGACLAITEFPLSDKLMQQFWEVEDIQTPKIISPEDSKVERDFERNVKRLESGRYVVSLPLIDDSISYPTSRDSALSRFLKLESKLGRDPGLKQQYCEFMKEYQELNHMRVFNGTPKYFIPHHPVLRGSLHPGVAPKLRVVFDASMKTTNGSLNDNLYPGPKLQNSISTILLNFRAHKIVFCTDIVKMFRQILVNREHTPFQCVFWRNSPEDPIQTFELLTITYGEACSPYLAIRTLRQLCQDEGPSFPLAAKALQRDVYVDDIVSGADSIEDALELKKQLLGLLNRGCFPVHKWSSNSQDFLDTLPEDSRQPLVSFQTEDDYTAKILGMHWDAKSDAFCYRLKLDPEPTTKVTKRSMLSVIARLFDPLGFLSPVILVGKLMIQRLWTKDVGWDDTIPNHILSDWRSFTQQLLHVQKITVPRWLHSSGGQTALFGFCDASERSYAAALYVRVNRQHCDPLTFLLTSKTRLAPIKTISIPKLELCAAHLLTKLLVSLQDFITNLGITSATLFSDSTVVLSWLRLNPQQLKTFVANRVGYIVTHTHVGQWRHVPSSQNPADIASRGILASQLMGNQLWWNGPEWLRFEPIDLPPMPATIQDVPEKKTSLPLLMSIESDHFTSAYLQRYSDFKKLVRVLAYMFRFLDNCRATTEEASRKKSSCLTAMELERATHHLIKHEQRRIFASEFNFSTGTSCSGRLKSLMAFLDTSGVLRVGGRLALSPLPYYTRHPVLLPTDSILTSLLIDHHHVSHFHLGAKALQAHLQRRFYIFGIKSLIRKRIWKCLRCYKLKSKPNNPLMADLPPARVSCGSVFLSVGVDFAGPYFIKQSQRRNAPTSKAYMCIFVCMAVKAVHIELVSSLSTEAFLMTFDRFISRRGLPTDVFSDCGTNFIGASSYLKDLIEWHNSRATQDGIIRHVSHLGVKWHFNPPSAPHFGGLWEAAVKSAKSHIRRTMGDRPFYFEELTTIFAKVEAILNSRPLGPVSSNPYSFDYLTPGHFLIGSSLNAPPDHDLTTINTSLLNRWQLVQATSQVMWRRWTNEYLHLLQSRPKWTKLTPPIKINDFVLIRDPNTSPLQWKVGRIQDVYPDHKGTIRVALVRTPQGTIKRPVHRLVPLDPINSGD